MVRNQKKNKAYQLRSAFQVTFYDPFHMLGIVSSCATVTLSFKMHRFCDIRLQKML